MPEYATPPLSPLAIAVDAEALTLSPEGPTLTRRMSDLEGLFRDHDAWAASATGDEPYAVLAVYPGGAGHDYSWVLEHGMGRRAYRVSASTSANTTSAPAATVDLRPYNG